MKFGPLKIFLPIIFVLLFLLSLLIGKAEVSLSQFWDAIFKPTDANQSYRLIFTHRLHLSLATIFTGVSLPVSGFLLQELFRNPLAGPSVFGITSAAGLGVAIVIFLFGLFGLEWLVNDAWVIILSAMTGALLALFLILFFARKIQSVSGLIIIGFMIAGFTSALIGVMQYFSASDKIKTYVIWGFGSLSGLNGQQIFVFFLFTIMGFILSVLCLRGLSAMQLGEQYAQTMGIRLSKLKLLIILSSAILTASATAFVGPISFIGLAIPHICRSYLRDYRLSELLFSIVFVGMILMLIFMIIAQLFPYGGLPINLITALFGAPIVVAILLKYKNL